MPVFQFTPPHRGPNEAPNEVWLCLLCPAAICVHCYWRHTKEKH